MQKTRTIGSKSRIDGALHRSLPATLSIRAAEPEQSDDGLLRLHISASSETPYLRTSWWDDPWIEVLGHKAGEVNLERFTDGAGVVLANHNRNDPVGNTPLASIGLIENATLANGRMEADLVISRRDALADLRQDIADGLVRNISIGYQINERTLTRAAPSKGEPDEYRVTSWTPFEISLVDIPAEASIGLGRSATDSAQPGYRVVEIQPMPGTSPISGDRTMPPITENPAADTQPAATIRSIDPLLAERDRMREIQALGRQFGLVGDADAAIESGASIEAFRKLVTDKLVDHGKIRPAETPEIGMSKKDIEQFSFCRALLAAADPHHAAALAPFEIECSRAAQDKRGDSRDKTRDGAITIPADVLSRGLSATNDGLAASVANRLMSRAQRGSPAMQSMVRDLVVGTGSAGGNLVATELLGSSFIDMLRNVMVLDKLGVPWFRELNGNVAIPSQTGGATTYWVAENGAVTESQQTFGQVTLTPKTIGAFTDYARRLLLQSSIDVEMFVRMDLALQIANGLQDAAFNGSGSSNQPTGLLNTSGIGSVAGGTNGLAPTYTHMVDLETAVSVANADVGALGYCTNAKVRGTLRKTQEFSSTNGKAVWTRGPERGVGDVLGYDAYVSNSVPSNLTKGTSSGVCSAIMFGNWADLLIGMWGGLDVMLDPYTGSSAGTKRVVALQDVDIAVRRVGSFASMKDALTA